MIGVSNWPWFGLFSLSATLFIYNAQRLIKLNSINPTPWLSWVKNHSKWILALCGVSGITAATAFMKLEMDLRSVILVGGCGIISFFYVLRIREKNLRELPFIKIILIALVWTIVLIGLPGGIVLKDASLMIYLGAHFIYVVAVTIPFDIRDLPYDKPSQRTIPQLLGVTGSRWLGIILLGLFYGTMLRIQESLLFNVWFNFAVIIQSLLILNMDRTRGDLYTAGAIDGAISLLGISYFFS